MSLLDINTIQIQLIKESDLDASEWIKKHSAHFRTIIKKGVININDIKFYLYFN